MELHETLYLVASQHKLVLIRRTSLKSFRCFLKFSISLTQRYRTKLDTIVPDMVYFKLIILKFKVFIYNSSTNIMYNFCICWGRCPHREGESNPSGGDIF